MIDIKDPKDCCGCTACASICNQNAITMVPDALGFLYPKVDVDRCVNCGLCEKVCSFHENYDKHLNLATPDTYAVRHKDMKEVESSRSGAAFVAISDYVLDNGGVVYGAGFKDHFIVTHKRAVTKQGRDEFKGSKYVQSDLNGIFRSVKLDLKNGKIVLFSGTPCQTAGLNSYVGKKLREKLILVDIVCHGVPSPYIWKDYIYHVEKNEHGLISNVCFRDKQRFGWTSHIESFKINQKKIYYTWFSDNFYKHIFFRESCGNCHFCNTLRPSDMTLADFWGWDKLDSKMNLDDKGCSLLFVNTKVGQKVFNNIKSSLFFIPAPLDKCMQPQLQTPCVLSKNRDEFERDYVDRGFDFVFKKYGSKKTKKLWVALLKYRIRKIIPNFLIILIKKIKND